MESSLARIPSTWKHAADIYKKAPCAWGDGTSTKIRDIQWQETCMSLYVVFFLSSSTSSPPPELCITQSPVFQRSSLPCSKLMPKAIMYPTKRLRWNEVSCLSPKTSFINIAGGGEVRLMKKLNKIQLLSTFCNIFPVNSIHCINDDPFGNDGKYTVV